ncbi:MULTISPECIES: hypothetical protein [unclassified Devosia]|uniref:hypothetical protein n=1 Tax=unclassified Devosia TaxID=196773 RepID=UPI001554BDF2|nr:MULTISPECIES: hypothetical protein [unclassified Devosia]
MERTKANERIVLSRHTLTRYRRMIEAGSRPLGGEAMIREELGVLDEIAANFPDMEDKLASLSRGWSGLLSKLEMQLN